MRGNVVAEAFHRNAMVHAALRDDDVVALPMPTTMDFGRCCANVRKHNCVIAHRRISSWCAPL